MNIQAPITNEVIANGIQHTVTEAFKVDHTRGERDGTVSSQWFSRPADQRFLSMTALAQAVHGRSKDAKAFTINTSDIRVSARSDNPESLRLEFDTRGHAHNGQHSVAPNNWSFGQLASLAKAPAGYLRQLPAALAGINLQYGLANTREEVKAYFNETTGELMAATGPDYGRVPDLALVNAVMQIVGNGTGDTRWKIPGVMDWSEGTYNPFVNPTTDTTTLYASDRDVFGFLVDDTHPIEVGKLADGSPDLLFRGFYFWNSEVGSKTLGADCFYLRGVCQNRNLWGVENQTRLSIRHSKNAPRRFASEISPALIDFTNQAVAPVVRKVADAKAAVVARNDDERVQFLAARKFSKPQIADILDTVLREEGKAAESIWDMVQGITAVARNDKHTDSRLAMERIGGGLMAKV